MEERNEPSSGTVRDHVRRGADGSRMFVNLRPENPLYMAFVAQVDPLSLSHLVAQPLYHCCLRTCNPGAASGANCVLRRHHLDSACKGYQKYDVHQSAATLSLCVLLREILPIVSNTGINPCLNSEEGHDLTNQDLCSRSFCPTGTWNSYSGMIRKHKRRGSCHAVQNLRPLFDLPIIERI